MMWNLWTAVAGCLLVSIQAWYLLPPDPIGPAPYWIDDSEINWFSDPQNTTGYRGDYHLDLKYITRPLGIYGEYKFLELVYKVCGASYRGFRLFFTNAHKHMVQKVIFIATMTRKAVTTEVQYCKKADLQCFFFQAIREKSDWKRVLRNVTHFPHHPPFSCSEERKLRIKWQEVYPWRLRCYMEPNVGEIFNKKFVFSNWTNRLIFSTLRDPTKNDDRGIRFYYRGRI